MHADIHPLSHRVWAHFFEKMGWEFVHRPDLQFGQWRPDFLLPKPHPCADGRRYFLASVMPTCQLDPILVNVVNEAIIPKIDEIEMVVLLGDSLIDDHPWFMALGHSLVSFRREGPINSDLEQKAGGKQVWGSVAWRTAHITRIAAFGDRGIALWPNPEKRPDYANGITRIGYTGNDQMYGLDLNISAADVDSKFYAKQMWLEACNELGGTSQRS